MAQIVSAGVAPKLQTAAVWSPSVSAGTQAFVAFRPSFVIDHVPESAQLHLFAEPVKFQGLVKLMASSGSEKK
jgi:hypothetical protein